MGAITAIAQWFEDKPKTLKNLTAKYLLGSQCVVAVNSQDGIVNDVYIEFHGECSRIPSMKNSKLPGKNFLNPEFLARLKAMDGLYAKEIRAMGGVAPTFGTDRVAVLLICGKRSRSFDPLNCADTISDWLEPSTKKVGRGPGQRDRGWGCGLIENDSQVTLFPIHSEQTGITIDYTRIIIRRWSCMQEAAVEFVSKFMMAA